MKKNSDSGNLSIDFLVGFTIFLLAFIWVVSMIPGLLINLQGYTIDYDAVTYRTGVILAEDPGEPSLPTSINPWESLLSSQGVVRFGLAESKDTPMILSQRKVESFFCLSMFSYPVDYQSRTIFGDYPYQFNISLIEIGSGQPPRYVGDIMPATSTYGSIRRLVKIKQPAIAIINASSYTITGIYDKTAHPDYLNGENETVHEFIVLINKSELFADKVRNPIYQIDPSREKTIINITNLNQTMYPDRTQCFNINLTKITIINDMNGVIVRPPIPNYKSVIDGIEYNQSSPLPYIKYNLSLIFDPPTYWSVTDKSYINLTFNLVKNTNTTECPPSNPAYNFTGSRFLNNTFTSPVGYNYSPKNVIQPKLQDAVLEIRVGSGTRTVTETLIAKLAAAFTTDLSGGLSVAFKDTSTGNPVEWDWDFGDGTSHGTTNNPTHAYASQGIKTVTLIIKDVNGVSDSVTKTIDLSAPVAGFIGAPLSGNEPLNVQFTDTSTGGVPTSWKWEFNETSGGVWTQFNTTTTQNPWNTFTEGTYDIRLTANNTFGGSIKTIYSYISVIPPAPVASFNTTPSPATGPAPLAVTFTDTSTGGTPTLWDWDFGDGSPHSNVQNPPAHTYAVAGSYTAQLTVSNAGGSSSATKPVTVQSVVIIPFTAVGTTSWTAPSGVTSVEYLVVGGGGGGGRYGAGGGGGEFLTASGYTVIPGNSYTVTVGTGGNGGTAGSTRGTSGGNSVFATITATGGGGGGSSSSTSGIAGGSGGGATGAGTAGTGAAGGNAGGTGKTWSASGTTRYLGGGGGGASAAGGAATGASTPYSGGVGGAGQPSSISGSITTYACGGGGGGSGNGGSTAGNYGCNTAGAGAVGNNIGGSATANYGGGGGGGGSNPNNGGNGGSGIVIIKYTT